MTLDFFSSLLELNFIEHVFTTRLTTPVPQKHATDINLLRSLPMAASSWKFGEQIHSDHVTVVNINSPSIQLGTDALCTNSPNIALGISVADCCAIYVVDTTNKAIGLAHSGKKGTSLNIVGALIQKMMHLYNSQPSDLLVQLSPCIRPPHYEIDFAAQIRDQIMALGVKRFFDCGICTASSLHRYYSYRLEKGQTGRMLAALAIK